MISHVYKDEESRFVLDIEDVDIQLTTEMWFAC